VQKFVPVGIHHIFIGPDHLIFLVGLLLFGGSIRRLLFIVTGFTVSHSLALSLSVLGVVAPPERLVESIIALSIIYVGVDNLMSRDGRDMRVLIAILFGFIHGFGFASVLREMGLPRESLGWSLFSFNLGVEVGQLVVVSVMALTLKILREQSQLAARRFAYAGSVVVISAGVFWFVERVFLSGGTV
jgi:hydrogenase/urease accessory protein HupE